MDGDRTLLEPFVNFDFSLEQLMTFHLLQEDIETYILFGIAPVYFTLMSLIQNRHLKFLRLIEHRSANREVKLNAHEQIRKLKRKTPLVLVFGAGIHVLVYAILMHSAFRWTYLISIGIFYFAFLSIMFVNFKLKGASILKDTGDFGGLPG